MKVLFLAGIGVSFGEIYVAIQAARHLRERNHNVSFAFVTKSPHLIRMVRQSGYEVRVDSALPPLEENYFNLQIQGCENFPRHLKTVLSGHEEAICLIDYQHFFVKPFLFPNYSRCFQTLQEELFKTKKAIFVNDHSLWTLPIDFLENKAQPPPSYLKKIFLPAPPHYHRYSQVSDSHEKVFFFDHLFCSKEVRKKKTGRFKVLLSISHFSLPLSDRLPVIPVKTLLEQVLLGLSKLPVAVDLTITGFGRERFQGVKIPGNVFLVTENKMVIAGFDDYDQSLKQFDGVILFNRISTTIVRAFFFGIPVLLISHSPESAKEKETQPFDIYPSPFPTMDLICEGNPFFDHCFRSDLFDEVLIEKNLLQMVSTFSSFPSEEARNALRTLPSLGAFFAGL